MNAGIVPLAHGAAGGFDEILFLVAAIGIAAGFSRLMNRRAPTKRRWVAAPLIVGSLLVGAVPIVFALNTPRIAKVRPASTAKLTILEPQPGAVITGTKLIVKVGLTGARIVKQASQNIAPDTGHVHLSLDGRIVTLLAGLEYDLEGLTPGAHLLQAEFAAADHGPFRPRVITTVSFTVR